MSVKYIHTLTVDIECEWSPSRVHDSKLNEELETHLSRGQARFRRDGV